MNKQAIINKYGTDTAIYDLPENEMHTGGELTALYRELTGDDLNTAYTSMRDQFSWIGTLGEWISGLEK